jgi:hypothetical protein
VNLWLDDVRPAPLGWVHTANVFDAMCILSAYPVEHLSLDHDLGTELTGFDLLRWMKDENKWPTESIAIHSMNPVGRERMEQFIAQHCPLSKGGSI